MPSHHTLLHRPTLKHDQATADHQHQGRTIKPVLLRGVEVVGFGASSSQQLRAWLNVPGFNGVHASRRFFRLMRFVFA
jgi:hypothetical protein